MPPDYGEPAARGDRRTAPSQLPALAESSGIAGAAGLRRPPSGRVPAFLPATDRAEDESAAPFVNTLIDEYGFKTDVTHFAIYGTCSNCQQ